MMSNTNGAAKTTTDTAALALGRILQLGSRPTQAGDVKDYERCRCLILDALAPVEPFIDHAPNYARDRQRGSEERRA